MYASNIRYFRLQSNHGWAGKSVILPAARIKNERAKENQRAFLPMRTSVSVGRSSPAEFGVRCVDPTVIIISRMTLRGER
jgi:hypothetical protein